MDPGKGRSLGLRQRNQTEKPSTSVQPGRAMLNFCERETKKLIRGEASVDVSGAGQGGGGGGGACGMGTRFPGKQSPCWQSTLHFRTHLFTVSWSRGQVCLGTSTHVSREAARELPGKRRCPWVDAGCQLPPPSPRPGSFLRSSPPWTVSCQPLLVEQDSLFPAPWSPRGLWTT